MPIIKVNGIKIYYEFHGPAEAAVLVLNNGIIMNAVEAATERSKELGK